MGIASCYLKYAFDRVHPVRGRRVMVVGPGNDREDFTAWCRAGANVLVVQAGTAVDAQGRPKPTVTVIDEDGGGQRGAGCVWCHWGYFENVQSPDGDYSGEEVIWATHVLEHALNPHAFLLKAHDILAPRKGHLMVAVPPAKPQIVGGHVNLFNTGLLMYRLALAGFDCRNGVFDAYGYNLFADVQPHPDGPPDLESLDMDAGDIEKIADRLPMPRGEPLRQGFDGNMATLRHWAPCELDAGLLAALPSYRLNRPDVAVGVHAPRGEATAPVPYG